MTKCADFVRILFFKATTDTDLKTEKQTKHLAAASWVLPDGCAWEVILFISLVLESVSFAAFKKRIPSKVGPFCLVLSD